ncbi:hypothetical protein ABH905_002048 [Pseudomonas frederiksbergensis]
MTPNRRFGAQASWKWSYRKRRSIHDRTLPRETLITRKDVANTRSEGRWSRHSAGFFSEAKL